jgi:hypothetical protein
MALYRKLWRAAAPVYEADLARSLSNAGIMLWMAGRRQEGVVKRRSLMPVLEWRDLMVVQDAPHLVPPAQHQAITRST